MSATEIIAIANVGIASATRLIGLYLRVAKAANAGDMTTAQAELAKARSHFDQSIADWEAARGGGVNE